MPKNTKKVLVALPEALMANVDFMAQAECRTRSDLIREALRRYHDNFKRAHIANHQASTVASLERAYDQSTAS